MESLGQKKPMTQENDTSWPPRKGSKKSCKDKGLRNFPGLCTANLLEALYYTHSGWDPDILAPSFTWKHQKLKLREDGRNLGPPHLVKKGMEEGCFWCLPCLGKQAGICTVKCCSQVLGSSSTSPLGKVHCLVSGLRFLHSFPCS